MLYSKNGSIPKPETDGTEGWIEVEVAPAPGPNQEVVWWYPPGWVVRPSQPIKEGFIYDWSQSEGTWVESAAGEVVTPPPQEPDLTGQSDTIEIAVGASSRPI